jgi:hypothetical protein
MSSQKVMTQSPYSAIWHGAIENIDCNQWNRLAIPMKNPFLEWEWLYMLEKSKSISPARGWYTNHLTLYDNNRMIAAAPLYIKTNSDGEYVYDIDWLNIANRNDIPYYPKMVGMTPMTPVPGYRFLVDSRYDEMFVTRMMVNLISQYCKQKKIAGCHFLYVDSKWISIMHYMRFVEWKHYTFQWHNQSYKSFDDFLQNLKSSHRRNIKKEIKALKNQNIHIKIYENNEIPKSYYLKMAQFYSHTGFKYDPHAESYFKPDFFDYLSKYFGHRSLFIGAYANETPDEPLALAYFTHKERLLSGRYWGAGFDVPFLHFNVCYYSAIQWAIENNIQIFDPGAGGNHKLKRGFPAILFYSLHFFYDWRLQFFLCQHIDEINQLEHEEMKIINRNLQ